jgi:hypothetical protein
VIAGIKKVTFVLFFWADLQNHIAKEERGVKTIAPMKVSSHGFKTVKREDGPQKAIPARDWHRYLSPSVTHLFLRRLEAF